VGGGSRHGKIGGYIVKRGPDNQEEWCLLYGEEVAFAQDPRRVKRFLGEKRLRLFR